ncbi:IgA peptidase M64-domain-containing protein [Naematelia encephala]|uniref:IgA peptidase M64-domain-containing protein n=1 Tax=Naematelia encephala TaxID=71784 RepID=A0A1Y2BBG1_9TREE|nr:IgA peptidase M64-domain-containing protein [Naematelia encephala]
MRLEVFTTCLASLSYARALISQQQPASVPVQISAITDSPLHPHIDHSALYPDDGEVVPPPEGMVLHPLHVSGPSAERVDLTFFSDGYTSDEVEKFLKDAKKLTEDIVSPSSAMGHVQHLLNVWAVFVPSNTSGVGTQDTPIPGAAFGLYRPGSELRAVFVDQPRKARAACKFFREGREGGCDQAVLLGNSPLYGGLGGEFTIITASERNGPLVLRHELGHSLIPVGEEYEGGYAYFGANSEKLESLNQLKWKGFLSSSEQIRVEDVKVPVQAYPWYDLSQGPYNVTFESSSLKNSSHTYPTGLLRLSMSSIPYPSHISVSINQVALNVSEAFPPSWAGTKDRRWLEIPLPNGIDKGVNTIDVRLTKEGMEAEEGQGGKMITSLEVEEYGGQGRFNHSEGFIGAFPTYAMDGKVTLRPTNDACLMRSVNRPSFCPVCADALEKSLLGKIEKKRLTVDGGMDS